MLFFAETKISFGYVSLVYKHFKYCLIGIAINIVSHIMRTVCLQTYYFKKPHFRVSACLTSSNLGKSVHFSKESYYLRYTSKVHFIANVK